ncbi:MAG: bifunctional hydroxymethylpyrimidine kinase/phosphomethylpyrimidine kinase [Candidatus Vogelbacteria bacterium]|nr:bifunctional hydroxymethylpyrimidine kinase/phosphomethylpyrimidine kinase [Candidatus Vogelbacteria bacterium]
MKKFDFVSIGDIVTDAFIRLASASGADTHEDNDKHREELCISFGDKIPYEFVKVVSAVGNSTNAAIAAARLGLNSSNITNQGVDEVGEKNLETLRANNVVTDYVISHDGMISNYHYVLWFGTERTILVKHEAYPYTMPADFTTNWLYLSSLGAAAGDFHNDIEKYLDMHPEVNLAFQPGTFQFNLGVEKLKKIYERTNIFFCNKEETQRILRNEESDVKKLLTAVRDLGPKIVVITDGPGGAYCYDGNKFLSIPLYPDIAPPYERTGAGDAYSSTIVSALAIGKPLEEALLWGPINSMFVVQKIGATEGLLHRQELEKCLAEAPADYKLKEI